MKKFITVCLAVAASLCSHLGFAQETLSGSVVSRNGEPIIGVEVKEYGTGNYATTNLDGKFTISTSQPDAILQFSMPGFRTTYKKNLKDLSDVKMRKYFKERNVHLNLYYASQELENPGLTPTIGENPKSDLSIGLSFGKTFFFNKEYENSLLKFGITADWINIEHAKYIFYMNDWGSSSVFRTEIGAQVGPAMMIDMNRFKIQVQAKYAPAFAYISDGILPTEDEAMRGFANGYSIGGDISCGFIGLGIEYRSSSCKHSATNAGYYGDAVYMKENKTTHSGLRFYLSLKF